MRTLVIGSRSSPLAVRQAEWVRERLRAGGREARLETIRTSGDRIPDRALAAFGGKGIFVKEIEEALLSGGVDLAVHSLKDLPTEQPEGLVIACVPCREDARDLLVARGGPTLADLPRGAVLGTGSPRRACQARALRPDLLVRDLRGNVETRLAKQARGDYDAIVVALAGLRRLGLEVEGRPLSPEEMLPAVGQGALAVEVRTGDGETAAALRPIHDATTAAAVAAERAFLRGLGGGCQAPIAALGAVRDGRLDLQGLVGDAASGRLIRGRCEGPAEAAGEVGLDLARRLLERGAAALLQRGGPPAGAS